MKRNENEPECEMFKPSLQDILNKARLVERLLNDVAGEIDRLTSKIGDGDDGFLILSAQPAKPVLEEGYLTVIYQSLNDNEQLASALYVELTKLKGRALPEAVETEEAEI